MKNNFLRETLIFSFALSAMFLFLSSSKSNINPNTRITITINDENLINKKDNLKIDLNSLTYIDKVEISVDADVIVLDVDNEYFDSFPVKQIFDKWELDYNEEFDTAVIADSEF
jgi:hypothetical protein